MKITVRGNNVIHEFTLADFLHNITTIMLWSVTKAVYDDGDGVIIESDDVKKFFSSITLCMENGIIRKGMIQITIMEESV